MIFWSLCLFSEEKEIVNRHIVKLCNAYIFLQLLDTMSEPVVLNVLLKHLYQLVTYYASFPQLAKLIMKVSRVLKYRTGVELVDLLEYHMISQWKGACIL